MLAGHDAELAAIKQSVVCLEQVQQAAATAAGETAQQVVILADHLQALEEAKQHSPAAECPAAATQEKSAATPRASQTGISITPVGLLNQADLVTAIEGLAADAAQGSTRLDVLEGTVEQQEEQLKALGIQCASLSQQLVQVCRRGQERGSGLPQHGCTCS